MNIKKLLQSVGIGLGAILLSASVASAANNIFQNGSNVGIGTTTPGATLGIAGNILASSTATSTFQGNGINITAGCFALNGGCVGGSGGSGTVTSVAMTTPTGLTVSGSPITTSGTLGLTLTSGYNIPLTASTTNWDTLYHASTSLPYQAQGNYITALTGDVTASGPGSVAATLATVNTNIGSWGSSTAIPNFTVNGKGLITAAGTNVVIAPAGTLSGTTLNSTVVTSSLTSANLANLTAANSTLTFSGSYNGNTARTVGLNLGNANTWTALQTFGGTQNCVIGDNGSTGSLSCTDGVGNSVSFTAASKALQVTGQSTFTALTVTNATSTNATSTNAVVSGSDRLSYITGLTQCLHVDTNGNITGTGSDCGAGGGGSGTVNSGTTGQFPYYASSGTAVTATSTLFLNASGFLGVGTTTPSALFDVNGGLYSETQNPATSTSMTIDFCASSNSQTVNVGAVTMAITFTNANKCVGKSEVVNVIAPSSGTIGATTFAGGTGSGAVVWDGGFNPGNSAVLNSTDRFLFTSMATSTNFISADLAGTY